MNSTDQVLEQLRAAILRGEYAPRERLVELEIADEYDVSRFIARKALVQLAAERLVDIQPNRGARVREISVDEAIALTEVRRAVEGFVASRAAERIDDAGIARLRVVAADTEEALHQFEIVRYSEVNNALHTELRSLAAHEPANQILERLHGQIVQHQFILALLPGRPAATVQEHLAIIEAVCAGDAEAAERAMRMHISNVIAALETFRDGGSAATTGIRELASKIKPSPRHNARVILPSATVAYGSESPNQLLDLYLPESRPAGTASPLVLAIHGGAFMMGDRTWELTAVPLLLDAGFAVASIEYRLSGEAPFPAAIDDVKRATAFLRERAAYWNLDPRFFAAWGRSAGGYLAAMLGVTSAGGTEFDPPGQDASVAAVIDWYGPSDFLAMDRQFAESPPTGDGPPVQVHDSPASPESRFLGSPITEVPELVARANPIIYAQTAETLPPFFLAAGTNDRLVPHQQTLILADALRERGADVTLRVLRDASHADHLFEARLVGPAIEWLRGLLP